MKLHFTLILSFILVPTLFFGQDSKSFAKTTNAKKSLQIAEHLISVGSYEKAEAQLQYTIKIKDNFAVAYRELGKLQLRKGDFEAASKTLEKSFELDRKLSRAAFFECGEAYFRMGLLEKAVEYYDRYEEFENKKYANAEKESALEMEYDERLKTRRKNLKYLQSLEPSQTTAENLGTAFNSPQDDYLPTISNDGNTIIFTRRNLLTTEEDIYINKKSGKGNWAQSQSAGKAINTDQNEGMAKFATHSKYFYFAGCNWPKSEGGCDIYSATYNDGEIEDIKSINGQINSPHWDSQPSVSCDGKTMFFSSIRPGGFGGADIYYSELKANGTWAPPINMGAAINTKGDEEAPYIATDGQTLYFSSDGHLGQGEGDIYMSRKEGEKWSNPINLGTTINSTGKELGFFVDIDGKSAYFASSKFGGQGGLDIYTTELPEAHRPQPTVQLEGYILNAETKEPLASTVRIGSDGNFWNLRADQDGWFFLCVPGNKAYSFQVEASGYEYFVEAFFLDAKSNAPTQVFLELQPKKTYQPKLVRTRIEEQRVQFFFDFDSFSLNNQAKVKLDNLISTIKGDDGWTVEVIGFADQTGNAEYNKKLSEKRAEAIVNYLSASGVETYQVIKREGKGAIQQPQDGRQKDDYNRRVDVVLRK